MYSCIINIFHCHYRLDISLYTSHLTLLSQYILFFWCTSPYKHNTVSSLCSKFNVQHVYCTLIYIFLILLYVGIFLILLYVLDTLAILYVKYIKFVCIYAHEPYGLLH